MSARGPEERASLRLRLLPTLIIGAYAACWPLWDHLRAPLGTTDFDQLWFAIHALQNGQDPYRVIGPSGPAFLWPWPFYYPITALVLLWPLGALPLVAARAVFVGVSSALLAFGLSSRGWFTLLVFLTPAYVMSAHAAQWSVLFTAAMVLPWVWIAFPAKPNIGVIAASGSPWIMRRRVLLAVLAAWTALVATSLVIAPHWISEWIAIVRSGEHFHGYIARLGGPLLLLAVLRWRRPEARLLLASALVPHTTVFYETLPVFLVARNRREMLALATLSGVCYVVELLFVHATDTPTLIARQGNVQLWTLYLPALALVLSRANEGDLPVWLERLANRLPAWLRGHAPSRAPLTTE